MVAPALLVEPEPGLPALAIPNLVQTLLMQAAQIARIRCIQAVTEEHAPAPVDAGAVQGVEADAAFRDRGRTVGVMVIPSGVMYESADNRKSEASIRFILRITDNFDLDARRLVAFEREEGLEGFILGFAIGISSEHADRQGGAATDYRLGLSGEIESVGRKGGGKSLEKIEGVTESRVVGRFAVSMEHNHDTRFQLRPNTLEERIVHVSILQIWINRRVLVPTCVAEMWL